MKTLGELALFCSRLGMEPEAANLTTLRSFTLVAAAAAAARKIWGPTPAYSTD